MRQDLALPLNTVSVCYQDLVTHCECLVEKEMDDELHIQYWKTSLPELRQSKDRSRSHFGRKDGHRLWGKVTDDQNLKQNQTSRKPTIILHLSREPDLRYQKRTRSGELGNTK